MNTFFFLVDQWGAERKTQDERQDVHVKGRKSRGGLTLCLIHIFIDLSIEKGLACFSPLRVLTE